MNIKKYMVKALSFILCLAFSLNNFMLVNAEEFTVTEKKYDEIEVVYNAFSSYSVIIPKTIVLDANKQSSYSIQVTGDIASNQRVYVSPVDGISDTESTDFYMKDQTPDSKKADVVATVTQNKFYWSSEEVTNGYEETNNSVSAPDLTAGTWKGTFQVKINLETEKEHTHNYVDGVCTKCGEEEPGTEHIHNYIDGKCECGEIDPDHTHNYEDGECTICGKNDLYEVAPASAYSNWNYTLDEENEIVTLNYYTGNETDVIVYANYEIGGRVYRTQIKSSNVSNNSSSASDYMFAKKDNIETIIFSDSLDTSNLTSMNHMFYACYSLTSIDFGNNFDTSNVTSMSHTFSNCRAITNLDLSSFDTSKVTDMYQMFAQCYSLTNLDLSNFDTSNVTKMGTMFYYCSSLTDLDLSSFDTSKVTIMYNMFEKCSSLTSLDLSSFDTSKVTDMSSMFSNCTSLTSLDLSSFDTSKV